MKTIEVDAVTGQVTEREWTQEEIASRKERLRPIRWREIRAERNKLLDASDNRVLPDRWRSMTAEQQDAWSAYRQALRDLPQNTEDPFNPVWPVAPS